MASVAEQFKIAKFESLPARVTASATGSADLPLEQLNPGEFFIIEPKGSDEDYRETSKRIVPKVAKYNKDNGTSMMVRTSLGEDNKPFVGVYHLTKAMANA